jgi:ubiquitin-like 1-activating enzyme E1 B
MNTDQSILSYLSINLVPLFQAGNVDRKSTKQWAQENGYSTQKLFQKFFNDDIKYLLSMDKLWAKRRPPTPLDW